MPVTKDPDIQHPNLVAALTRLADSLDQRESEAPNVPSYLVMAALADQISDQLHELARMLVTAARAHEKASWADVGDAFGVTRQAAMRRWTASDVG